MLRQVRNITMNTASVHYNNTLMACRHRFATESVFAQILNGQIEPDLLELFWIYYCSIGVGMTEPVEGWIRRAGESCGALGWTDLGRTLITNAKQEAGHHLLMIADAKSLIDRWNRNQPSSLSLQEFLPFSYPSSVLAYAELHEAVIAGEFPFCQIAIEYEIESLAVQYGAQLIAQSKQQLGADFGQTLSFIQTHVTLDADHAEESQAKLEAFLAQQPEHSEALAIVGQGALNNYRAFLDDCLTCARERYQLIAAEPALVGGNV
jgi:hypothetical protein